MKFGGNLTHEELNTFEFEKIGLKDWFGFDMCDFSAWIKRNRPSCTQFFDLDGIGIRGRNSTWNPMQFWIGTRYFNRNWKVYYL